MCWRDDEPYLRVCHHCGRSYRGPLGQHGCKEELAEVARMKARRERRPNPSQIPPKTAK